MNLTNIPKGQQADFIGSFWTMLRECECKADNENDPILKRWVEGWYLQWNTVTKDDKKPVWVNREEKKNEPAGN